jgi:Cu2+-exporting ATPase
MIESPAPTTSDSPASHCALCGLPLRQAPPKDAPGAEPPLFCCPGCATVHAVLHGGEEGSQAQAGLLVRFGISTFLALNIMMFSMALYGDTFYGELHGEAPAAISGFFRWVVLLLSLPAVWLLGEPQVRAILSTSGLANRAFHGLILLSVGAALLISFWAVLEGGGDVYFDTAVMLLLLATLGRLLEGWLRARAAGELQALLGEGSRLWRVRRGAEELEVSEENILAGDLFEVRPGERVPVDGVIVEGQTEFGSECRDGGLLPLPRGVGDGARSGELNLGHVAIIRAEPAEGPPFWKVYRDLARAALDRPVQAERIAAKVAAVLLPLTMALALGTFAFWRWRLGDSGEALMIALSVLAVACPCAMGLATPIALRLALGEAAKLGALPASAAVFETLARVDHFIIDNTGTMTGRDAEVAGVRGDLPPDLTQALLALARKSLHPAARAAARWAQGALKEEAGALESVLREVRERKGSGLEGRLADGALLRLGSRRWLESEGVAVPEDWPAGALGFSRDAEALAALELDIPLHPETAQSLEELLDLGCGVSLMTGAASLPPGLPEGLLARLNEAAVGQTPADKTRRVEELRAAGRRVAMVGDGLNDLPAIAAADVGIAIGDPETAAGSAAQIALPAGGGLAALPKLVRLARKTRKIIRRNFAWVIGYNSVALGAAALGWIHPLLAALLMAGSSAAIIGQSFLLLTPKPFVGATEKETAFFAEEITPEDVAPRG